MENYTVGDVRRAIEGLDDSQAVFGFVMTINSVDTEDKDGIRQLTPEEWEATVMSAEQMAECGSHSIWDSMLETLNDAKTEVCPDEWEEQVNS